MNTCSIRENNMENCSASGYWFVVLGIIMENKAISSKHLYQLLKLTIGPDLKCP